MWNICKEICLGTASLCYGILAAAGVFTVLIVIGLIPRFAGRTNTAAHVMRYEDMVIAGTISGGLFTIFDGYWNIGAWWQGTCQRLSSPDWGELLMAAGNFLGQFFLVGGGFFCGMFIGCFALAIAEMLDGIPIFTRRVCFEKGISLAIFWIAIGKIFGSILYFIWEINGV